MQEIQPGVRGVRTERAAFPVPELFGLARCGREPRVVPEPQRARHALVLRSHAPLDLYALKMWLTFATTGDQGREAGDAVVRLEDHGPRGILPVADGLANSILSR